MGAATSAASPGVPQELHGFWCRDSGSTCCKKSTPSLWGDSSFQPHPTPPCAQDPLWTITGPMLIRCHPGTTKIRVDYIFRASFGKEKISGPWVSPPPV